MTHKTLFPFNMSSGKIHLQTWKYLQIVFIVVKFAWFKSFHHCYMISNVEHMQLYTICFMMRPDIQTCFVFNYLPPRVRSMGREMRRETGRLKFLSHWYFNFIMTCQYTAKTQSNTWFILYWGGLFISCSCRIPVPYLACIMLQRSRRTA